jgi:hypothetical protein
MLKIVLDKAVTVSELQNLLIYEISHGTGCTGFGLHQRAQKCAAEQAPQAGTTRCLRLGTGL